MSAAPLRAQPRFEPVNPPRTGRSIPGREAGAPQRSVSQRPALRAVTAPAPARSLAPFAWTCLLIVMAALAVVLVLNTTMAEGAYRQRELKIEIANLHQERAEALTKLESAGAPGALAQKAQALGMVPAAQLGYVRLADAQLLSKGATP